MGTTPNVNVYIPTKEFFNSRAKPLTAVPTEQDTWYNKGGVDQFVIEVSGAEEIKATVEGCINLCDVNGNRLSVNERAFSALKIIDLSTLTTTDEITKNGLYAVGVGGVANIRINITALSGNVIIVGSTGSWEE